MLKITKENPFTDQLALAVRTKLSPLVVGLDPQLSLLPPPLLARMRRRYGPTEEAIGRAFLAFNKGIIDAALPYAPAFKPQRAFYEEHSFWTEWAFAETVKYIHRQGAIAIEDGKRGDGGATSEAYANGHIGRRDFWGRKPGTFTKKPSAFRVDCLTVQPGIGDSCILPFVKSVLLYGTGIFLVAKSSFVPNSRVEQLITEKRITVWEAIAFMVNEWGRGTEGVCGLRNVGVVMGATYPGDAPRMRDILPNVWFLIPGFGGQGGTAEEAVVGINPNGLGGIVNSSRNIIYAYRSEKFRTDPRQFAMAAKMAAMTARDELVAAMQKAGKWFN